MPFLYAWSAKPDDVVEVVFVEDESVVAVEALDANVLLAPLFAISSSLDKFCRVNRARLSCGSLSSPSLPICRFRNDVVDKTRPCSSLLA